MLIFSFLLLIGLVVVFVYYYLSYSCCCGNCYCCCYGYFYYYYCYYEHASYKLDLTPHLYNYAVDHHPVVVGLIHSLSLVWIILSVITSLIVHFHPLCLFMRYLSVIVRCCVGMGCCCYLKCYCFCWYYCCLVVFSSFVMRIPHITTPGITITMGHQSKIVSPPTLTLSHEVSPYLY